MHDEDDIHEPEHDHLLDREFFDEAHEHEPEAHAFDPLDEDDVEDDDSEHPAWHDDPDD